ncbi:hypothetical protein JW887_04905 [Candidatus Dojkabacteria bacterium]|nr:hypothetical protein [Candidatus Dojkabacteria bacterium]
MVNTDVPVIDKADLYAYIKGEANTKVHSIWNQIVAQLDEKGRREAILKGFFLRKNSSVEEDSLAKYLMFDVKHGSKELKNQLFQIAPYIICMK